MAAAETAHTTIAELTLEAAIEKAVGPLKPLFEAAAAWGAVAPAYRARQLAQVQIGRRPPDPEHERLHLAFVREQEAAVAPFIQLLRDGKLVAQVRSLNQIGAPMRRLRRDEVPQLRIKVHISGKSLLLYGPGGEKLHALFSSPPRSAERLADLSSIGTEDAASVAAGKKPINLGRRGPAPIERERVAQEMRKLVKEGGSPAELRTMKQEAMAMTFRASRETCVNARKIVLSEFVGVETPTNGDPN